MVVVVTMMDGFKQIMADCMIKESDDKVVGLTQVNGGWYWVVGTCHIEVRNMTLFKTPELAAADCEQRLAELGVKLAKDALAKRDKRIADLEAAARAMIAPMHVSQGSTKPLAMRGIWFRASPDCVTAYNKLVAVLDGTEALP